MIMAKKLDKDRYLTVIIEVHGGIATVVQKPKGVGIIIHDYDNKTVGGEPPSTDLSLNWKYREIV
jgi:hypothetical protein